MVLMTLTLSKCPDMVVMKPSLSEIGDKMLERSNTV
jgi:hypothetical protein